MKLGGVYPELPRSDFSEFRVNTPTLNVTAASLAVVFWAGSSLLVHSGTLATSGHRSNPRSEWLLMSQLTSRVMAALVPGDDSRNRPAPSNSLTPPYVTAQPEVTYRKISRTNNGEELKFVVLATDGCELNV